MFRQQRIEDETLGEYLRYLREFSNCDVKTISGQTGIAEKFIIALENSDYNSLPADVYVHGFLKLLGDFYKLKPSIFIDQYKIESALFKQPTKQPSTIFSRKSPLRRISITPKFITIFISIAFFSSAFFYIAYQVVKLNKEPGLSVIEPSVNQTIIGSFTRVRGKTDVGAEVSLNGKTVLVNSDGEFSSELALVPGTQELVIQSKSRLGKAAKVTIPVIIKQDEETQAVSGAATENKVSLELISSEEVNISLETDGEPVHSEKLTPGLPKYFKAQKSIVLNCPGGVIKASKNGTDLGTLGEKNIPITNMVFTP